MTVDTLIAEVVLPYLQELGARWERGEASIAQEHFASGLLRGRLLGMARGWAWAWARSRCWRACRRAARPRPDRLRPGPARARLAHRAPRSDSPVEAIAEVSASSRPDLVVLSAVDPERLAPVRSQLVDVASRHRLAIGGAAAQDAGADGILRLSGDVLAEAARVSA